MDKRKKIILVLIGLILAIIIIYFLYSFIKLLIQPTDTFIVENGKISLQENAIGYIIREETVIKGQNYKNGIVRIKEEGEKVAKDDSVFRYYSNGEEKLKEKIAELDTQIQEALQTETNIFLSDIALLETEIESKLDLIFEVNDIQQINEIKKQIQTNINKKAEIAGQSSASGSYVRNLIEQRSQYENEKNSGSEYITAPVSGLVSYRIDNLEEVLKTDDFSYISKNLLEGINIKTGQLIDVNDESGKIVNNYICYIATVLDSEEAKQVAVGKKLKIELSNNEQITAKVVYIAEEADESRVLVLEINKQVEELINYRKITFDIIWWSDTGYKVPNESIIQKYDMTYVIRNRAGYLNKILVKVVKQNENYTLVENYTTDELKMLGFTTDEIRSASKLNMYDEIVQKPTEEMLQ